MVVCLLLSAFCGVLMFYCLKKESKSKGQVGGASRFVDGRQTDFLLR